MNSVCLNTLHILVFVKMLCVYASFPTKLILTSHKVFGRILTLLGRVSARNRIANMGRDEASSLIEQGKNESKCSQAIASGYQTLIAINDYLTDQIEVEHIQAAMTGSMETERKADKTSYSGSLQSLIEKFSDFWPVSSTYS